MSSETLDENRQIYLECIQKQLEEIDLLSSIFCNPGEIHIYDPNVISDFNEYVSGQMSDIRSEMDFSVYFEHGREKVNIRIQLPHLYPLMENAKVTLFTPLLPKDKERNVQHKIESFIDASDKSEGYIYQVVLWIQDEFENFLTASNTSDLDVVINPDKVELESEKKVDLERLWIYSHHIKSKWKRREILEQAQQLKLTGFCKPGKPGIICVEGLKEDTQEFWRIIRSLQWQRITLKLVESRRKSPDKVEEWRRFQDFREKLMNDTELETEAEKMDMSLFMKFLDKHRCGYIKQELFGFN